MTASSSSTATTTRYDRTHYVWWYTLETSPQGCKPDTMGDILTSRQSELGQLFKYYSPPSETSRKAVESLKATIDGTSVDISTKESKFVLQLSSSLNLDEIQSLRLLRNYIRYEVDEADVFGYSDLQLLQARAFYFEERRYMLHILMSLLRIADDSQHAYHSQADKVITSLLQTGLEETVFTHLKDTFAARPPQSADDLGVADWSTQFIREQVLLCELLFRLYYERVAPTRKRCYELLSFFIERGFGSKQVNSILVTSEAERFIRRLGDVASLLILECLNIEPLLEADEGTVPSGASLAQESGDEWFNKTERLLLATPSSSSSSSSSSSPAAERLGPILLAWASLGAHTTRLGLIQEGECDYRRHLSAAVTGHPFLAMRACVQPSAGDPAVAGAHAVVRGVLALTMQSFDISRLPNAHHAGDLAVSLYSNRPQLCQQFWLYDAKVPATRSLLDDAQSVFPAQPLPLIRFLTALSSDTASASAVYRYLHELPSATLPIPPELRNHVLEDDNGFTTSRAVSVAGVDIPQGTRGLRIGEHVCWQVPCAGWELVVYHLDVFVHQLHVQPQSAHSSFADAGALLKLITAVTTHQPEAGTALCGLLRLLDGHGHSHINANNTLDSLTAVGQEETNPLLVRVLAILGALLHLPQPPIELITICAQAVLPLAVSSADKAALVAFACDPYHGDTTGHIAPAAPTGAGGMWRFLLGWKHTLQSVEVTHGDISATLALFDVLLLLSRVPIDQQLQQQQLQQSLALNSTGLHDSLFTPYGVLQDPTTPWEQGPAAAILNQPPRLAPYYQFIAEHIFCASTLWSLRKPAQRFQVNSKCLELFTLAMEGSTVLASALATQFLHSRPMISSLLASVGPGREQLSRLRQQLRDSEAIAAVNEATSRALTLFNRILRSACESKSATIPLAEFVFAAHAPSNVLATLVSYTRYGHDGDIPRLAVSALASVTEWDGAVAVPQGRRLFSLVSYLGTGSDDWREALLIRLADGSYPNKEMRLAILNLLAACLSTSQFGVATLLLRKGSTSTSSNVRHFPATLRTILSDWKRLSEYQPALLVALLRLLYMVWQAAPNSRSALVDATLWSTLLDIAKEPIKLHGSDMTLDDWASMTEGAVQTECALILAHAWVLRILAAEHFLQRSSKERTGDKGQALAVPPAIDSKVLAQWGQSSVVSGYDADLVRMVGEVAASEGFSLVHLQHAQGDIQVHGHSFVYRVDNVPEQLAPLLRVLNGMWSICDAQTVFLRAWAEYSSVYLLTAHEIKAPTYFSNTEGALLPLLETLATDERTEFAVLVRNASLATLALTWLAPDTVRNGGGDLDDDGDSDRDSDLHPSIPVLGAPAPMTESAAIEGLRYLDTTLTRYTSMLKQGISGQGASTITATLRTLFTAAARLVVRVEHDHSNDAADVILGLIETACAALQNDELTCVATHVLLVAAPRSMLDPNGDLPWLPILQRTSAWSLLARALSRSLYTAFNLAATGTHSPTQTLAAYEVFAPIDFLLFASSIPAAAASMVVNGVMDLLSTEALSMSPHLGEPYDASGERSISHRMWLRVIALVTNLLHTLRHEEQFLHRAFGFVSVHARRLSDALSIRFTIPPPIEPTRYTLGFLEETEYVVGLLYRIAHYPAAWKYALPGLALAQQAGVLQLLHELVLLMTEVNHRQLGVYFKAVSRKEIALDDSNNAPGNGGAGGDDHGTAHHSNLARSTTTPATGKSATSSVRLGDVRATPPKSPLLSRLSRRRSIDNNVALPQPNKALCFIEKVEGIAFSILSRCVNLLRLLTPRVFHVTVQGVDSVEPLFSPSLRVAMNSPPSVGTLFKCQNHCLNVLAGHVLRPGAINRETIHTVVENSLYLVLTHAVLDGAARSDILNEIESFTGRVRKHLPSSMNKDGGPDAKLLSFVERIESTLKRLTQSPV